MKKREFIFVASILTTLIMIVGSIQAGNIQTKKSTEIITSNKDHFVSVFTTVCKRQQRFCHRADK